jgi:hypothetical protein
MEWRMHITGSGNDVPDFIKVARSWFRWAITTRESMHLFASTDDEMIRLDELERTLAIAVDRRVLPFARKLLYGYQLSAPKRHRAYA